MALLQNGFRDYSSGVRIFGATASNNAYPSMHIGNWDKAALKRNLSSGTGITSDLAGIPSGYRDRYTWVMPQKPGALASRNAMLGTGALSGSGAMGVNGEAALTAVGTLAGTGALVVSGLCEIVATGTLSANVIAALAAAADLAGSGALAGTLEADGFAISAMTGTGTLAITSYATGELECNIAPAVVLDAQAFSAELLATEIEPGLTLEGALKLIAAATAGKISGGGTGTITIRNAVADTKDRIVATVETDGDRTAITYDLTS